MSHLRSSRLALTLLIATTPSAGASSGPVACPSPVPALAGRTAPLTPQAESGLDSVVVDGKEHRGRVLSRHGERVRMTVDGRRLEWDAAEVQRVVTRSDHAAAWLDKRRPGQDPSTRWRLIEAARAAGLPNLAQLAALELLLDAPDHEPARELVGHRGRPGAWQIRFEGRWLGEATYAREIRDGLSLELHGEHFRVLTDAGLERGLQIAFDLELLHARWAAEFAPLFESAETTEPLLVEVHAQRDTAEVFASQFALPYYDPGRLLGSILTVDPRVVTWYEPLAPRPLWMFDLATQGLIYNDVLQERLVGIPRDTTRYRENAALEIGLGAWVQRTSAGPPGHAVTIPYALDPIVAELARRRSSTDPIAGRLRELPYLLTVGYERLQLDGRENALLRAKLELFIAWLLDPATQLTPTRTGAVALGEIVRSTYLTNKGLSTSAWDRALGERIERLEPAWRATF